MDCPNGCASELQPRLVERIYHRCNEPVVIANLLVYTCPECGHESIPLATARRIEAVLDGQVEPSGVFSAKLFELESVPDLLS